MTSASLMSMRFASLFAMRSSAKYSMARSPLVRALGFVVLFALDRDGDELAAGAEAFIQEVGAHQRGMRLRIFRQGKREFGEVLFADVGLPATGPLINLRRAQADLTRDPSPGFIGYGGDLYFEFIGKQTSP